MGDGRHLTVEQVNNLVTDFCPEGSTNPAKDFDSAVRNFLGFVLVNTAIPEYDVSISKYTYDEPLRFLIEIKNVLLGTLSKKAKVSIFESEFCKKKWKEHMNLPEAMRPSVEAVTYSLFDSKEKCNNFKECFRKYCVET